MDPWLCHSLTSHSIIKNKREMQSMSNEEELKLVDVASSTSTSIVEYSSSYDNYIINLLKY